MLVVSPEKTTIGFIGMGVMGNSMADNLIQAGYNLHIYTRTKSKAKNICEKGGIWEDSIKDLSLKCNLIITMLGFPKDVKEVYLSETGILKNAKPETILIDMTTSSPELALKIYNKGKKDLIHILDAPVSGGDIGAKKGTLSIMVGGDKDIFDALLPIFKIMGENIVFQGSAGKGQHTKIANQIAIASCMIGVCESLAYSKKAGLDQTTVLKSIGQGAAGSWSLNNLGPRIIAGDYKPGFYIKHFIKDMIIAHDSASNLNLDTPGLILAKKLYKKLTNDNNGTQALYKLFK